jgi:hypothetical protein
MREAAFTSKPRARVMVYRDWLCDLAPVVNSYVQELCHKRRAEMKEQMLALYELAQEVGNADFVTALELAAEQQIDVRRRVCASHCEPADRLCAFRFGGSERAGAPALASSTTRGRARPGAI